jgi:hypothetical protein
VIADDCFRVGDHASRIISATHPIDEQLDTGHEAAVVGREEHGRYCDLVWITKTAQRHTRYEARLDLLVLFFILRQALQSRGFDRTWADSVGAVLALLQVDGPTARKRADWRLGSTLDAECRHTFD